MLVSTESRTLLIPKKAEIAAPLLPFASIVINCIFYFSAAVPPPVRISKDCAGSREKTETILFYQDGS